MTAGSREPVSETQIVKGDPMDASHPDATAQDPVIAAPIRHDPVTRKVPTYEEPGPEDRFFADQLPALAKAGRDERDLRAAFDHSHLYDSHGAPK